MLVCSGGVIVVIASFYEETIYKAVVCVIISSLPRECCVGWYIRQVKAGGKGSSLVIFRLWGCGL
jgi:hypothetical protein